MPIKLNSSNNDTVRYKVSNGDLRYLYKSKDDLSQDNRIVVNSNHNHSQDIFVDILEIDDAAMLAKLKLFYSDGKIVVGWTNLLHCGCPVVIHNEHLLFDGRFNSTKSVGISYYE